MMRTTLLNDVIPLNLLWLAVLILVLALPVAAEAGRFHHGHHHHHHGHHHHGGYALIYDQPRVYYNQPYIARPGYGYNYYSAPVPVYVPVPAPVYTYPPNVMMDINTGLGHFFFSY